MDLVVAEALLGQSGEPEAVFGRAYTGPTGTDWVFTGSLRFPGGVLALFDCATCLPERDELAACRRGACRWRGGRRAGPQRQRRRR